MSDEKKRTAAVVLAGGSGTRMGNSTPKQYIDIGGYPLIYYSLKAFSDSFVDEIVLVCKEGEEDYCSSEIVERYGFSKVKIVVPGGDERYHSVYNGLKALRCVAEGDMRETCEIVFIHDGARPFITDEILTRAYESADKNTAAIVAVPSKDTVKIADQDGFTLETTQRDSVWLAQTPQVFDFYRIYDAYSRLMENEEQIMEDGIVVTDDAMVLELFTDTKVKLVMGDYRNIKITTADDLAFARYFVDMQRGQED